MTSLHERIFWEIRAAGREERELADWIVRACATEIRTWGLKYDGGSFHAAAQTLLETDIFAIPEGRSAEEVHAMEIDKKFAEAFKCPAAIHPGSGKTMKCQQPDGHPGAHVDQDGQVFALPPFVEQYEAVVEQYEAAAKNDLLPPRQAAERILAQSPRITVGVDLIFKMLIGRIEALAHSADVTIADVIDLLSEPEPLSEREQIIEGYADLLCALLGHEHTGRPRCEAYEAAKRLLAVQAVILQQSVVDEPDH